MAHWAAACLALLPTPSASHCVLTGKEACYHDEPSSRVLPYPSRRPPQHPNLDRQICMQLCADAGCVLAGVEGGRLREHLQHLGRDRGTGASISPQSIAPHIAP